MSREIWRLLDTEVDTRQPGDEIQELDDPLKWTPCCKKDTINGGLASERAYRRRETIEDEPKWEEVKDRIAMTWGMFPKLCRYEDGTFHVLPAGQIQSHKTTHYLKLPLFPQASVDFETFWQRNKQRMLDTTKEAARVIYEEARK